MSPAEPDAAAPAGAGGLRDRLAALQPGQPRDRALGAAVRELLARALDVPVSNVDDRRPLGELGVDSATALAWKRELGHGLGIRLPSTLIYAFPTVAELLPELSRLVDDSLADAVSGGRPQPARTSWPPEPPAGEESLAAEGDPGESDLDLIRALQAARDRP